MGAAGGETDLRGGRGTNLRGREDADREGEGWNKVKPRKSFGQDGAERFTGRMGGESHRQQRDDRGRERDDLDASKDRRRTFDTDGEEGDAPRRNGLTRGKPESWSRDTAAKQPVDPTERALNRERIEKAKSWRSEEKSGNPRGDRGDRGERGERSDRNHDRRWDTREREQRPERAPEWLDEPVQEKNAGHTQEDFRKFMERARGGAKAAELPADSTDGPGGPPSFFTPDSSAVQSAPVLAQPLAQDAFFARFSNAAATTPGDDSSDATRGAVEKQSKFARMFSAQPAPQLAPQPTEPRGYTGGYTEPSTPAVGAANGGGPAEASQHVPDKHWEALMSKLQSSKVQGTPTPPNANAMSQPPPPQSHSNQSPSVNNETVRNLTQALDQKANLSSPDPPLSFGLGRPEEPRLRSVPPQRPELMQPRPMQPPSQPPTVRNDQLIHELLAQRPNAQSQGSVRSNLTADPHSAHLMQLLQHQQIPDQRPIEPVMRLPPQNQRQPSMHFEPEPSVFMRDHGLVQQRQMQPLAGFENQFRRSEGDGRMMLQQQQQQPPPHPHILQRQQMIPPGLDHGPPPSQQMYPPLGQRQPPMIPQPQMQQGGRAPPGLLFGSGPSMGNGPPPNGLPPNMLQPGNSMHDGPPRGMPPPGFFAGGPPPHGGPNFMPPPGMGVPFPGPDAFYQPGPGPYDGRGGMPPPGGAPFRR